MTNWAFNVKLDWTRVVAYLYFVMYGYFGAMTPKLTGIFDVALSTLLAILLAVILVGYWVVSERYDSNCESCIVIDAKTASVFFLMLVLLTTPVFERLNYSLYGDELSYAGSAHGHAVFLGLALARMLPALGHIEFGFIAQAISFLLLALLVVLWLYVSKASSRRGMVTLVVMLLLFRLAFFVKGGNGTPHPPGELLPVLITGALFGLTELGLKLSYFLPFVAYVVTIYKMVCRKVSQIQAFLFAAAMGTLPLLWGMSTVIEHALWGHIAFSLIVVDVATSEKINYRRLVIIISIGAIFRQSVFLALVPVVLLYLIEESRRKPAKELIFNLLVRLSPTLLFLPFLLRSLLLGTPATGSLDESIQLAQVVKVLISGHAIEAFLRVFQPFWAAIMLFAFLPLSVTTAVKNGIIFLLFAILLVIYYSIDSSLLGLTKYQSEYVAPFILVGGVFLLFLMNKHFEKRVMIIIPLILLVFINIGQFIREAEGRAGWNSVSVPYDYKQAYSLIKKKGLNRNTFSIGVTYGVLPEIINGYTAADLVSAYEIYRRHMGLYTTTSNQSQAIADLVSDNNVKAVLIQNPDSKRWIGTGLTQAGWRLTEVFADSRSENLIHLLER